MLAALGSPSVAIANNSYASTRAVLVHEQSISLRNGVYDTLQGAGLIMAASLPFFARPNAQLHFSTLSTIVNGPLLQAYNLMFPDPIVKQLTNLDDQSLRDNLIIANNDHIKTLVFVEKQAVTDSLQDLKLKLGFTAQRQAQTLKNSQLQGDERLRAQLVVQV